MGRIILIGEVSGKRYEIYESSTGEIRIRNITDANNPLTASSTTITDASGVALNAHASRHAAGGADAITGLAYTQLGTNQIYIRVPLLMKPRITGVDASTTGVKISELRIPFSAKHVKKLALRSQITSITSGVTFRVGVYNVSTGSYVIYRDYTSTGENEDSITSGFPSDGNILELRGECTVAVSGGSVDINYLLVYVDYGVS